MAEEGDGKHTSAWDKVAEVVIPLLVRNWFERWVGVCLAILGAVGFLYVGTHYDLTTIPLWLLAAGLGIGAVIFLGHWAITKPRQTKKGHIGVLFALLADSPDEEKRMAEDFVTTLRNCFDNPSTAARFDFIEVEKWRAAKIVDTATAQEVLLASQGQILIWGSVKVRVLDGKEYHILCAREIVLHSAVGLQESRELSTEMALIFPTQINVSRENDLIGLQITSAWLGEACQYFVAVAALMSGDLMLAQMLLEKLESSSIHAKVQGAPAVTLRNCVRTRLADVHFARLTNTHVRWRRHRRIEDLEEAHRIADVLKSYAHDPYAYHLEQAIYCFVKNRDLKGAQDHIWECRRSGDATWRISKAFLSGYEGDLDTAMTFYLKAAQRQCEGHIPVETEEFMTWVLEQEPDKAQIHFCLAYLNWKLKGDPVTARRDFQAFIDHPNAAKFPKHVAIAREFLAKQEEQLGA
jgi:hypothetical protein